MDKGFHPNLIVIVEPCVLQIYGMKGSLEKASIDTWLTMRWQCIFSSVV